MDVRETWRVRWSATLHRLWKEWALAVVLGAVALLACAKLGEDVFAHETGTFDDAVQHWMQAHQSPAATAIFLAITYCGSVGASLVAAALSAIWLWKSHGRRIAATVVLAPGVATAIFSVVKLLYARPRPVLAGRIPLHTYSFPSGHSTASAAVWCTLSYVTYREGLESKAQAVAVAILVPLLVGLSRLYLSEHWATDVLGGWSLGLLVSVIAGVLYERHQRSADPALGSG
ncbi:MAG TPA: phosphatase PAP2 family protein [Gemmatimonadaceae bacterium]|nr:phosphatase PAP2 family protein [Gemmatimonadaceae bacterium]